MVFSRRLLFASGAVAVLIVVVAAFVALSRPSSSEAHVSPDGSTALSAVTPAFDETLRSPPVTLTGPPAVHTDAAAPATDVFDAEAAPTAPLDASVAPVVKVLMAPTVNAGVGTSLAARSAVQPLQPLPSAAPADGGPESRRRP